MSKEEISAQIASQLASIKGERGNISLEDITDIIVGAFSPSSTAAEKFLCDEITAIANHIQATKNEVLSLASKTSDQHIGSAAVQLDAVIKATEEAAHTIMDTADEIQNAVAASSDEAVKQSVMDLTGRIYEACNFQDLTGQRIKKVMQALDFTEEKIKRLTGLFTSEGVLKQGGGATASAGDELLNGPQLPHSAPSQADIDAMLNNLK